LGNFATGAGEGTSGKGKGLEKDRGKRGPPRQNREKKEKPKGKRGNCEKKMK